METASILVLKPHPGVANLILAWSVLTVSVATSDQIFARCNGGWARQPSWFIQSCKFALLAHVVASPGLSVQLTLQKLLVKPSNAPHTPPPHTHEL